MDDIKNTTGNAQQPTSGQNLPDDNTGRTATTGNDVVDRTASTGDTATKIEETDFDRADDSDPDDDDDNA